jgi:hypothetical protein
MGCCENKRLKLFSKEVKIEPTDKKSQINLLNGILKKIEKEIKEIKEGVNKFENLANLKNFNF